MKVKSDQDIHVGFLHKKDVSKSMYLALSKVFVSGSMYIFCYLGTCMYYMNNTLSTQVIL